MPDPEALARTEIDRLLTEAGWLVMDRDQANIFAGRGIAIREVSIPGAGEANYLLIADKRAIGIIGAKAQGIIFSGVEPQTKAYAEGMPGLATAWVSPLPMFYESTGIGTRITQEGGAIEAGYLLQHRDRMTRAERWQQLAEDYTYAAPQIDLDGVVPDHIRPGVPKTLIFAKNDSHPDTSCGSCN